MTGNIIPKGALSFEEALEIYGEITEKTDENSEDGAFLLHNLKRSAARYSRFRTEWYLKTQEERVRDDGDRTSAHDAFISAVNMMARYLDAEHGWRERLGNDRKRIGDFAAYISLFSALDAR